MVFATGLGEKADTATEIMNRHGAVELEEVSALRPQLPTSEQDEAIPAREISVQNGRIRSPGSGARLFVW
jgi:hypothetical protein